MQSNKLIDLVPVLTLRHGNKAGGCVGATAAMSAQSAPLIVTGSMDGRLVVWSALTGRELAAVAAHNNMILTLFELRGEVDKDSTVILDVVSHGRDGQIRLWTIRMYQSGNIVVANADSSLRGLRSDDIGLCKACFSVREDRYRLSYVNYKRDAVTSTEIEHCPATDASARGSYKAVSQYELAYSDSMDSHSADQVSQSAKLGMCMAVRLIQIAGEEHWLTAHENGSIVLWGPCVSPNQSSGGTRPVRSRISPLCTLSVSDTPLMTVDYSEPLHFGLCGSTTERLIAFEVHDPYAREAGAKGTDGAARAQGGKWQQKRISMKLRPDIELTIPNAGVSHVRFDLHGRLAAIAGWDNRVRIVSLRRLHVLAVISFHRAAIHALVWSFRNDLLIASEDALVTVWTAYRDADASTKQTAALLK